MEIKIRVIKGDIFLKKFFSINVIIFFAYRLQGFLRKLVLPVSSLIPSYSTTATWTCTCIITKLTPILTFFYFTYFCLYFDINFSFNQYIFHYTASTSFSPNICLLSCSVFNNGVSCLLSVT
jgi:hypothetical protein